MMNYLQGWTHGSTPHLAGGYHFSHQVDEMGMCTILAMWGITRRKFGSRHMCSLLKHSDKWERNNDSCPHHTIRNEARVQPERQPWPENMPTHTTKALRGGCQYSWLLGRRQCRHTLSALMGSTNTIAGWTSATQPPTTTTAVPQWTHHWRSSLRWLLTKMWVKVRHESEDTSHVMEKRITHELSSSVCFCIVTHRVDYSTSLVRSMLTCYSVSIIGEFHQTIHLILG